MDILTEEQMTFFFLSNQTFFPLQNCGFVLRKTKLSKILVLLQNWTSPGDGSSFLHIVYCFYENGIQEQMRVS